MNLKEEVVDLVQKYHHRNGRGFDSTYITLCDSDIVDVSWPHGGDEMPFAEFVKEYMHVLKQDPMLYDRLMVEILGQS